MVDLESPHRWDSGAANVILWGSAGTPLDNELFISQRMIEIRSGLDSLNLDDVKFVTLYGHGPEASGNDTSYIVDGETLFKRADLPADLSSSGESLNRVLTGIRRNPASHSLLTQVGHSGRVGLPLWGSGSSLNVAAQCLSLTARFWGDSAAKQVVLDPRPPPMAAVETGLNPPNPVARSEKGGRNPF